jgi:hypothetical protein
MEMNIEKLVEAQVIRELEAMDLRSIIDGQIIKEVRSSFERLLKPKCAEVAQALIENEIEECLDGEINTDDGWGKKGHYESFSDLFKKTIKEKLNGTWEMKKVIENLVKERCSSLIKGEYDKICEKITDEITKSKIVKG